MLVRYIASLFLNLSVLIVLALAQSNVPLAATAVVLEQIGTSDKKAKTSSGTYQDFLIALGHSESSNRDWYVNPLGHAGYFQFGETALRMIGYYDYDGTAAIDWNGGWTDKARAEGINSLQDFLKSHTFQEKALTEYYKYLWDSNFEGSNLKEFIGRTIGGIKITESGLLAGSHLVGANNVETFLRSGGVTVPTDPFSTRVSEYVSKFGGYDMSPLVGVKGSSR